MPRRRKRRRQPTGLGGSLSHLFQPSKRNNYRSKLLHPESILYFCLIVLASFSLVKALRFFPNLNNSILGYASNITAEDVLTQTNQQRADQGLSNLKINAKLSQAALAKGQDMFADQYWSHTSPDGVEPWDFVKQSGYEYKAAGENLARDFMNTNEMIGAWMESPTHRANIMNQKFEEIGIAVINGSLQGFETTLVVQMFGSPNVVTANRVAQPQLLEKSAQGIDLREKLGTPETTQETQVLAGSVLLPNPLDNPVLLTPLHLTKAFFLAVIILITATLIYDSFVAQNRQIVMAFNKNLGHLLVFGAVTFILIFFRSGLIQ
ncbi:MAG: CAP domain-containing protein [Candidatus Paceibacterota bacterium]